MSLADTIKDRQIVLVVMQKAKYSVQLIEVIKAADASSKKICYVSLNKPYNSIMPPA